MQRIIRLVTIGILVTTAASAAPPTLEGSADFESVHKGGASTKGKLYGLGKRVRTETEARGTKMTMIMDTDAKKMWILMPPPAGCMEQSLKDDARRTSFLVPGKEAKEEKVGAETIDGHPTEKYKITNTSGGSSFVHYVWRATDLKGFPVQTSDEAGISKTKFTNIKLEKPDAKLLEPPTDCKAMPNFAADLKKQMEQRNKAPAPKSPE